MRTIFVTIICLLTFIGSLHAQDAKTNRIKEIRAAYADAKKKIDQNGKNGKSHKDMSVEVNNVLDEEADITENTVTNFYFDESVDEEDLVNKKLYFISEYCTAHGNTRYCEMLFNPKDGKLMFSYMKGETDAGFVVESRYYFDANGRLVEQKHNTPNSWTDENSEKEKAQKLVNWFDMVNSNDRITPLQGHDVFLDSPAKNAIIKDIRSHYAKAKEKIDKNDKSDHQRDVHITIHDMGDNWPPRTTDINFYFEETMYGDDVKDICYFISQHRRSMSFDNYEEYLFEPGSKNLIFFYSRSREEGEQFEHRFYFDKEGRCIEAKTEDEETDYGHGAKWEAADLLTVFQNIMEP